MTAKQDNERYDKLQRTMARWYAYGRLDAITSDNLKIVKIADDFVEYFMRGQYASVFSAWANYAAMLTELEEAKNSTDT